MGTERTGQTANANGKASQLNTYNKSMYFKHDTVWKSFLLRLEREKAVSAVSLIWSTAVILIFIYNLSIIIYEIDTPILAKIISTALIVSSLFWIIHCVSYTDKLLKSILLYNVNLPVVKRNNSVSPKVAVLIPVFNEEPRMVESSLIACRQINYSNFKIYLLDDSTDDDIRNRLARLTKELNINYIHRPNRRGYKAGAINDLIHDLNQDVKYIIVIDADHKVEEHILTELVPMLDSDSSLSFIQTPQYFTKETADELAVLCSIQQHIFNKHVCRGLHVNDSAVITGSNVIIRLSHLRAIGGMDEACITEDIATSFNFQFHGYKGIFLDRIYAEGLSPSCLSAYFTEQTRWAYGVSQNFKRILGLFLKQEGHLSFQQWREHLTNGSWYLLSGWAFIISLLSMIIALIFDVKLTTLGFIGTLLMMNSILIMVFQFIALKRERNYLFMDILMSIALFYGQYLTFARSSAYAIIGKNMEFSVTPKTLRNSATYLPIIKILPYILLLVVIIYSAYIYINRVCYCPANIYMKIALSWAIYNIVMILLFIFIWLEDIRKVGVANGK